MKTKYPTYLVGGALRDRLMGIPCKDYDYVVVAPSFEAMEEDLLSQGCTIFVRKPEFLTIRCKHPALGCVDVACARKEGVYSDGRRPDQTSVAVSIHEDLSRRDFTCNAMAQDLESMKVIDPFNGWQHIQNRTLWAVGSARARFDEDKLRAFRALRFAVTKRFCISAEIYNAIGALTPIQFDGVSTERIREELFKMFSFDAKRSFHLLQGDCPILWTVVCQRGIWFCPTVKNI